MKRQASIHTQKKTMPLQIWGSFPHAAVRATDKHEMPSNISAETRFDQDFSRVAVCPSSPVTDQEYSKASCPLLPQRCPFGGACHTCPPRVRAKLKIGQPGDKYEREADRVADEIITVPTRSAVCCAPPRIQRCTGQANEETDTVPASVDRVLNSSGRPLEPVLRRNMEQRFGCDFSHVRVHSGKAARQSARDVNANAYTAGSNIVFGWGQYSPGTKKGRRLIAHELTHVVQSGSEGSHFDQRYEKCSASSIDHTIRRQDGGVDVDADSACDITLETGNIGNGFLNNLVHQQVCVDRHDQGRKRCFSFAATGLQTPQFSSTWLGWNSLVVGAVIKGEIYEPRPVSSATVVDRHTPTVAQGTRWLNYIRNTRLGIQDGYSVARHNCRLYSQWEFRDAPSHW